MAELTRRGLIEKSLASLAATAAIPEIVRADEPRRGRYVSPNEKIRIAVIGFNSRGMNHITSYAGMDDVIITHLCDADSSLFPKGAEAITKKGKPAPKFEQDLRKIMDNKDIDAVSIATPNHWHSLAAIWALQAGKDVYCEKPVSQNVWEGRKIVEAARKYNRICQTGTQSRGSSGLREAMNWLHEGNLGKITLARGLCYKRRPTIGQVMGEGVVPATVDYSLWLGPAPMRPPHRTKFHYDWHWQWDYGNGDLGNQGIHEMDKARWGLGKNVMPNSVQALGGRFGYVDDGETPNTLVSVMDYGDCQLIFEVRGLETPDYKGAKVGNIWYGDRGYMVAPSYTQATAFDNDGKQIKQWKGDEDHFDNFIRAVRSRKVSDLYADIEEGHLSSALCHLGNISYRLGKAESFDSKKSCFPDNKAASETFGRMEEHLGASGIELKSADYRLGRSLVLDPKKERFKGDKEADLMLTREYRKGFEVPAKV